MGTIKDLQSELDELEKRIKAISTAQTTMSQLMAITEYFDNVQTYLSDLNETYDSHIAESETYSTQIQSLQEQVNALADRVSALEGSSANTFSVMSISEEGETEASSSNESAIAQLQDDFQLLESQQQDLRDDVDVNAANISRLNTDVSTMQTTITNISNTQNSITSTHNTLTNTVSDINNRLSVAETNIDCLSGGINVGELDERISVIEDRPVVINTLDTYTYKMFINLPQNTPLQSIYYYYKTDNSEIVKQNHTLNYTSSGQGTLNIKLFQNGLLSKEIDVDLSIYPNNFSLETFYCTTASYQKFHFVFCSTSELKFRELTTTIYGANPILFVTDQELKVSCFGNDVYLIKYEDNIAKTQKTDINNVSLNSDVFVNISEKFLHERTPNCVNFGPKLELSGNELVVNDYFISYQDSATDDLQYMTANIEGESSSGFTSVSLAKGNSCICIPQSHIGGTMCCISESTPSYFSAVGIDSAVNKHINLQEFKEGNWYYCTAVQNNVHSQLKNYECLDMVAFHEDGNMYLIKGKNVSAVVNIGKGGRFATAYYQTDGSINVYVNRLNKTFKYNIALNDINGIYTSTLVQVINDCDCYYELTNNAIVKHTSLGWSLEN